MQFKLTNSQRYLVNAKPDANHSTNTSSNGNSKRRGNFNPTYPTNPSNPTDRTTKYHCQFVNIFAKENF